MEQTTKTILLNTGITLILVLALFSYEKITTNKLQTDLNTNVSRLNTNILQTKQELGAQVTTLQSYVDTQNEQLQTEMTGRITHVENKLNITRKEQQQSIKEVSGKIEQVQQENTQRMSEFEDQLKTIKIKNKDFTAIIQDILKSVTTIKTDKSLGSGVIISDKGYIVTNFHVIDGATQAGLRTYDNKVYAVKIIGVEKNTDIAVLKIEPQTTLTALEFETTQIKVGDPVIAVGNPAGLEFSVSEGIISATDRTNSNGIKYIQTDVPINPGNSGGPLVNIKSKIVGINTMKKEGMEGLGFAIHAEVVKQIADKIIQQYEQAQGTNQSP